MASRWRIAVNSAWRSMGLAMTEASSLARFSSAATLSGYVEVRLVFSDGSSLILQKA
jgi:hypothetical protein